MSPAELYLDTPHTTEDTLDGPAWTEPWAERFLPLAFGVALLAVDLAVVVGAFLLAFWIRFSVPDVGVALGFQDYVPVAFGIALTTSTLLALYGFYDQERMFPWTKQAQTIISAVSTALVLSVVASYFLGNQAYSRLWFAGGWVSAVLGLIAWRLSAHRLNVWLRDALAPANRLLIVGANSLGNQLARELSDGYQVVGYVDNGVDGDIPLMAPLLGPIAKLEQIINTYAINELVIVLPANRRSQISGLLAQGFQRPVKIRLVPDLAEVLPQRVEMQQVAGRAYIGFSPAARVSWLKRATDLVLGTLALMSLLPVLIAIAVMIKLDSSGPVFYRQERVGKNGRRFQMIKFRSMRRDADSLLASLLGQNEASGPLFKMRQDPRVTRIGSVLRRLSLDELPQVFNVLRGDMSLVGPRPPLPSEVAKYEAWQLGRLRAVPGMTGLWQVSGRSDVPFHDMVRLDLHYIRNWSFALDFEILLRTIPAVVASRGAF